MISARSTSTASDPSPGDPASAGGRQAARSSKIGVPGLPAPAQPPTRKATARSANAGRIFLGYVRGSGLFPFLRLLEQAAVVHVERGLRAIGELQLAEDVRDMRLHGAHGDAELRADLLVRTSRGDELQDLAFARRQVRVALIVIGLR